MTWIIRLIDKDVKKAIRDMLHVFKKIEGRMSMTKRDVER